MEENIKTYVVIKQKYKPNSTDPYEHFHEFYQLIYVASGSGVIMVNGENLNVKKGDVVFIAPLINHAFVRSKSDMTTYEVKFNILEKEFDDIASSIGLLHYEEDNKIKNLILKIIEESQECRPYFKKSIENFLSQIIIYLTRTKSMMETDEEKNLVFYESHSSIAIKAKIYFDLNYEKRVSLVKLAEEFLVSESHLCREFSKNFGMSPIKYLNNLRIEKAKELLSVSDLSVTEIAYKVGFTDIHYFSRYFNKQENKSPVQYRNEVRDNFVIRIQEKRDDRNS